MKIEVNEEKTVKAINEILKQEFPFAAALLMYALIERILKQYIVFYRNDGSRTNHCFQVVKYNGIISLCKYLLGSEDDFIKNIICKISLGDAETIIIKPKPKNYSEMRNKLMHSNFYFKDQMDKDSEKRHGTMVILKSVKKQEKN